ncbi:methionine--tRNA ligase subunit beta [Candidatus Campbellbacteria bacterium]|nr:MAG: methionine--tRNA ligase subunit beta [Candidatus Campbellbacteria bacterium]
MSFLNKIFNSKKGKKITKNVKDFSGDVKEKVSDFAENVDDKLEISEKFDDVKESVSETFDNVKEKVSEIDQKTGVSKSVKKGLDKAGDVLEEAGEKVEAFMNDKITFDDFAKVEIKLGEIEEAEKVEKSDKLLKLKVSFGREKRQIVSGIAKDYKPEELVGKKATFVTNLAPREIFGLESDGMILGVSDKENGFSILSPEKDVKTGSKAS